MIKLRKYIVIIGLFIFFSIPIFFGVFTEYLYITSSNWFVILTLFLGLFCFLFMSKIIERFCYNKSNVVPLRDHDVINAFINKENTIILCILLLIIISVEELIFRYYTNGIMIFFLKMDSIVSVLLSSLMFSLFHIHIWFRYRNSVIFLINFSYPFLLGIFNGYILLTLGIVPCIFIHYVVALNAHYGIYKRFFKI